MSSRAIYRDASRMPHRHKVPSETSKPTFVVGFLLIFQCFHKFVNRKLKTYHVLHIYELFIYATALSNIDTVFLIGSISVNAPYGNIICGTVCPKSMFVTIGISLRPHSAQTLIRYSSNLG